jgi:hypothetical protein
MSQETSQKIEHELKPYAADLEVQGHSEADQAISKVQSQILLVMEWLTYTFQRDTVIYVRS